MCVRQAFFAFAAKPVQCPNCHHHSCSAKDIVCTDACLMYVQETGQEMWVVKRCGKQW